MILLLTLVLQSCPPPLVHFDVHREDLPDGWTRSTGGAAYETRVIGVDYVDNRSVAYDFFSSQGEVTFTNATLRPFYRKLKYRHTVNIRDGNYTISQDSADYDVCADNGKVIFYAEKVVGHNQPFTLSWNYTIEIEPWGDLDGDGCINGSDLGFFFTGWGMPGATDFNEDGVTDGQDLGILLDNWNHC